MFTTPRFDPSAAKASFDATSDKISADAAKTFRKEARRIERKWNAIGVATNVAIAASAVGLVAVVVKYAK